ncbi:DNA gyrase subunit A [archaeon]|nr:DNA gyrase subunit A [archaeon]|tara:strand:- start:3103 stop:5517 length:2415 start_codon:yes stop_codon:yes gene_type:complete
MPEEIQVKLIEDEMKESYIDYAMSVITSRALPDVNDGLKPVHRRILYAMYKSKLLHDRPFRKSAFVIGRVLASYHPHGDTAVYDSLVRMAQDFSLRYPLVQGQGNFGSLDGDPAAASRYTEARLQKLAEELLEDIDKNTVKLIPNYDNSTTEPIVLPGKIPNLLVNGASGIAVGMATNIPPHNLREVCDATIDLINNPDATTEDMMQHIKGPDFPTGASILGKNGILQAYKTGKGKIKVQAKTEVDEKNRIIITEIPYQVNKSYLVEDIADLVRDKRVEGITDIRDESNKKGIRVVIELKQNANAEVILNQLYKHTQLKETFGANILALVAGQPKTLTLLEIIKYYIAHRKRIVTRRTQFELKKAEDRAHILEGLKIALANIDAIIKLIKESQDQEIAKSSLIEQYKLTEIQAQAILDMRLRRLTSLEQNKIQEEYNELLKLIEDLKSILASEQKILDIIKKELIEIKDKYGDDRRTQILDQEDEEIDMEELIQKEDVIVTATREGYIKRTSLDLYKQQRRGGTGMRATETKDDDIVEHLFVTSNHNYLLFFTNKGRIHWLKAFKVPEGSRYSKGKAIINLLKLQEDEKIKSILPIPVFSEKLFLLFATKNGTMKKSPLTYFSKPRKAGVNAIKLKEKDELVTVKLIPQGINMILASKNGRAVKFKESDARQMGRNSSGVRGIRLNPKDSVMGLEVAKQDATLLTITEKGFGKRTLMEEYRLIKRGGKGVTNIKITNKNGPVVGIKTIMDDDELMCITKKGVVIRFSAKDVSVIGRNTQGVRVMKLKEDDKVVAVARVVQDNGK